MPPSSGLGQASWLRRSCGRFCFELDVFVREQLPEVVVEIIHGVLDKNMALRVRGVWDEAKVYHPGECVTDHGSMFCCVRDTEKGERPGRGIGWRMLVKNGSAPSISRSDT